ncbi:MAG: hypothetical protein SO401_00810 [Blautia sp.]|nr:hypothetical protein [Blautia sp.]
MVYHQSATEQEIIINFDRAGDEANLYTADPVWIRKMDKLVAEYPDTFKVRRKETYKGEVIAKDYTFPKKLISIRKKLREYTMTEEQRQMAVKRLAAFRN